MEKCKKPYTVNCKNYLKKLKFTNEKIKEEIDKKLNQINKKMKKK